MTHAPTGAQTELEILTAAQVAALLQCHPRTIHQLIKKKKLYGFTLGREYRIPRYAYEAFIRARS